MVPLRGVLAAVTLAAAVACHGGFDPRDGDADGADPCEGVACSDHGTCVDAQGAASCVCETGYTPSGLSCILAGSDGDADADADHDLPPDAEADAEQIACDDADGDGVCDTDDQCPGVNDALGGQVNDEEFLDPAAWEAEGIASVADGTGRFAVSSCDSLPSSGALRQLACLPTPREGWPVVRAAMYWACTSCAVIALAHAGVVVTVGDDPRHFDTADYVGTFESEGPIELELCPGERAFGGIAPVAIDAVVDHPMAFLCTSELTVEHLWLDHAQPGRCPRPGEVTNGSVDPSLGGWTPEGALEAASDHEGWIALSYPASGVGAHGSVSGRLGVPLAETLPASALQMRVKGVLGEGARLNVEISQDGDVTTLWQFDALPDLWGTFVFCFPPATLGRYARLTIEFTNMAAERTIDLTAEIDDVAVVSDPTSCP